ncbi:beta-glucosidase family protein [Demequina sp.]|uniref:beta-glucosidase family protein n=1 Tax=Demequina sp. TaxID=2050685 RepID=UPI003D1171DF
MTQTSATIPGPQETGAEESTATTPSGSLDEFRALAASLPLTERVQLLTGQTAWRLYANEAIGLQSIAVSDGPVGVRGTGEIAGASSALMPSPSALAATWDLAAAHRAGELFASEARRLGVDVVLAPQVNIQRTPVGGRHFECYSEDPLLTSAIAGAVVASMQAHGVAACLKHFIANDSETARTVYVSEVDEQTLREVYLAPFEHLVKDVGVWSIMAAYNGVDAAGKASPMTDHHHLLTELLKDELGFDGVVVSDWMATRSTVASANGGLDLIMPGPGGPWEERLLDAVRGGAVSEDTINDKVARILLLAHRVGRLAPAAPIPAEPREDDERFIRTLAAQSMVVLRGEGTLPLVSTPQSIALIGPNAVSAYVLGGGSSTVNPHHIVDPLEGLRTAYPNSDITLLRGGSARVHTPPAAPGVLVSATGAASVGPTVTIKAADGNVLSEHVASSWNGWFNELPDAAASVTLSGAFRLTQAGTHRLDLGSVGTYRFSLDGETIASSDEFADENVILNSSANSPAGVGATITIQEPRDVPFSVELTVIDAGGYGRFVRADLRHLPPGEDTDAEIAAAVAAAASADLAVVIVGTNAEVESEGWDRRSLALPGRQDELVERVLDVAPHAVIVINAGAPVLLPWLNRAKTVLWAWFPGQECGHSLADVLRGVTEPAGRLPWTLPAREDDVPVPHALPDDAMRVIYSEGVHVGYRGWERSGATPAAPFGFGLGWTTWRYDEAVLTALPDGALEIAVTVTNVGEMPGSEVVQAYVTSTAQLPEGVDRPVRWLAGFDRVTAAPGRSTTATIRVPSRALEVWHKANWHRPSGLYEFEVGRSIRDPRITLTYELPEREETGSAGEVSIPS